MSGNQIVQNKKKLREGLVIKEKKRRKKNWANTHSLIQKLKKHSTTYAKNVKQNKQQHPSQSIC